LSIIVADTDEEALQIERQRTTAGDIRRRLDALSRQFDGHDFSTYDLDAPFPELPRSEDAGIRRFHDDIDNARRAGVTLRGVLEAQALGWLRLVGSPETIADQVQHWYESGAADGFNLFVQHPADWDRFRAKVVPILVKRGLFRGQYEAETLRGHLGLPLIGNRHAAAGQTDGAVRHFEPIET
jgi:alkanesulfonate monooxygenase SsuD/methylene tetrahydromethanopterin reductase-like flavin-dependent oxidoreductase (luciferase family)